MAQRGSLAEALMAAQPQLPNGPPNGLVRALAGGDPDAPYPVKVPSFDQYALGRPGTFDDANLPPMSFGGDPNKMGMVRQADPLSENAIRSLWTGRNPDSPDWVNNVGEAANTGMMAGSPLIGGIRAFHGSPHDFDAFDMSKIGTGEGAQAYGHGLYFAENPGVAKMYKEQLSTADISHPDFGDKLGFMRLDTNFANAAKKASPSIDMTRAETIGANVSEGLRNGDDMVHMRKFVRQSDWPQAEKDAWYGAIDHASEYQVKPNPGKTYEVDINAHPDEFLDWDKPLSEQPPAVQEALKAAAPEAFAKMLGKPYHGGGAEMTGGEFHQYALGGNDYMGPQAADKLRAAGIKGIRYADQGSRAIPQALLDERQNFANLQAAAKKMPNDPTIQHNLAFVRDRLAKLESAQKTHNFVVFDDKSIAILKKYGIAGLTAGGAAAAAASLTEPAQPGQTF